MELNTKNEKCILNGDLIPATLLDGDSDEIKPCHTHYTEYLSSLNNNEHL